ncbi:Uncharacterised protein [Bordetella pertussis]|nr:Uncharacterised protein [Bordetella pertussis]
MYTDTFGQPVFRSMVLVATSVSMVPCASTRSWLVPRMKTHL